MLHSKTIKMETITYYSYKGGTGRSLLVAASAKFLAECGKKVFLLDFDLEAPGLHCKFNISKDNFNYSLIDFITDFQDNENHDDNILFNKFHAIQIESNFHLLPAGKSPEPDYANKLLQINWNKLFSQETDYLGYNLFSYLKNLIYKKYKPDYLLVDSRTGISEIGGIALNQFAEKLVYLLINNSENIDGFQNIIKNINTKKIKIFPVIARVPINEKKNVYKRFCSKALNEKDEASGNNKINFSKYYFLHNETSLQVMETIKLDNKLTIRESTLNIDYLSLFKDLFVKEFEDSPYNSLFHSIDVNDLVDSNNEVKSKNIDESIEDRVKKRPVSANGKIIINILPAHYVRTSKYLNFIDSITHKIEQYFGKNYILQSKETSYNYDILGMQMNSGLFDFCGDIYFKTENRSQLLSVIKFANLETYSCLVKKDSSLFKLINKVKDKTAQEIMQYLFTSNSNLKVGLITSHASSSECYKNIEKIGYAHNIISFFNEKDLIKNWCQNGIVEFDSKIVFCDHQILNNLNNEMPQNLQNMFSTNEDELFLKYDKPIPVGLIYPNGDYKWRKILVRIIADIVKENNGINWEGEDDSICKELKESYLEPLSFRELSQSLLMDLPIEQGIEWEKEIKKFY